MAAFSTLFGPVQDQVEQLGGRAIAGEVAPGPDSPPELRVQRLDRVCGVDDPADFVRERKERDDLAPGTPPALADGGIALAPWAGLERRQRLFGSIGIDGAVDVLERCRKPFAVFPGDEVHGVAQQVDDAGLNDRLRETAVIASGKPFRPSMTASRISSTPRFLSSFITGSQNLAPSFCSSQAEYLLGASGADAQRDMDGFVANHPFVPGLDPDRVRRK